MASLAAAMLVFVAGVSYAQTPVSQDTDKPDFKVQIWGFAAADFNARMLGYAELRTKMERGLPALRVTDDPREIWRAEHSLAKRIRAGRVDVHAGELFTPAIALAFKQILILETTANACASIVDDNPGEFTFRINGTYPKRRPLSTVPPGILAVLPKLPADVQYRILGRHLILHDTRANVILDRIRYAIQCPDIDN